MDFWSLLFDIGVLLGVAFLFGALCERLHQSALLGYLLAGMLLGPNALNFISKGDEVEGLAEVGVCLLLFSLGLEFSWSKLKSLGITALGGGAFQVGLTLAAVALIGTLSGLSFPTAIVLGAAFALSSTAGVLRVLMARSEMDSHHGRYALGILLFQDLAVIPLVLLANFLSTPASPDSSPLSELAFTGVMLIFMVSGFFMIFNFIVPKVLLATSSLRNRELPVLFAVVGALGSIYAAHELDLSPAVGAFIAGMMLGDSPLATQVRADLSVLRTLLVTVFFSSIGMLGNPAWIYDNLGMTALIAVGIIVIKTSLCFLALKIVRQNSKSSLAAALCLSQVGEFAFVIAETSRGNLIDENLFMAIVSTMMFTLCLTPFLIAGASSTATKLISIASKLGLSKNTDEDSQDSEHSFFGQALIIGYGPAGKQCAEVLKSESTPITILDLNPTLVEEARNAGYTSFVGDGSHPEVLDHLHIPSASVIVVSLPDPRATELTIQALRVHAPNVPIIARSRYHRHAQKIADAGASALVDEEHEVGNLLGQQAEDLKRDNLHRNPPDTESALNS